MSVFSSSNYTKRDGSPLSPVQLKSDRLPQTRKAIAFPKQEMRSHPLISISIKKRSLFCN
ncbi:hypothetical protein [Nostoc sp. 2RC]|uniref:hypothetical protein n=1 Tax=Nostoc sp. 2RC TaxID=2485484 RepID=UPI001628B9D4|nr:hypothetical protein [Nostoc sp. 2RC]MBC1239129.1 hypothetical protein [Nostoc sp. 2RC]